MAAPKDMWPPKVKLARFKAPRTIRTIEGDFCALWLRDAPSKLKSVCEIFAVRVEGGVETGRFHTLVRPIKATHAVREQCAQALGLIYEEIDNAPEVFEVTGELLDFIRGLDIIVEEGSQIDLLVRCARYSGMTRIPNRLCVAGGFGGNMEAAEAVLDSIVGEHVSGPSIHFKNVKRHYAPDFTSFVAVDTETTGLEEEDMITEIGAVRVVDGIVTEHFQMLCDPGRRISDFVVHLTGITNEMVAGQPTCGEAARAFIDFCGSDILVAHNARFDLKMLAKAAIPEGVELVGEFFDTDVFAHSFKREQGWEFTKLGYLAEQLGVTLSHAHRALADAEAAAGVYLKLRELYLARLKAQRETAK